jgi:hypothetical protein
MSCCIKKYPTSPAESCAASREEILATLMGLTSAYEAMSYTEDEGVDDFTNNSHLPGWKQRCIRGFVDCENKRWTGNCYNCLRRCEGQQEWPIGMCFPPKGRK